MTRVYLAAALAMTALTAVAAADDERPEPTTPRLTPVGEVRIDMPEQRRFLAVSSPSGKHVAVAFAPRPDSLRGADTWSSLRMIDVAKCKVKASFDDLTMGRLPPAFSPDGRLFSFGTRKDDTTLTVHVLAAATGRGLTQDVPHEAGSRGFAEVCGVGPNAQRVAIREPADAEGRRRLMVYELPKKRRIAAYADFAEPYQGTRGGRVTLTGDLIAFHTRPRGAASGSAYTLNVIELNTSRSAAQRTAFASRTTSRYAITPDRKRLVNGTSDFDIEVVDLATGKATTLIDADDLYSHYLEVVLSADGSRAVTWSDERKLILAQDLDGGEPLRVELDSRAHVVGVGAHGRWAYVQVSGSGIVAVDLDAGSVAGTLLEDVPAWFRITADGRHLVSGAENDTGWTFTVRSIETP